MHIYITGHYNPSDRVIDLVANTTYVVCGNFIHKGRAQQLQIIVPLNITKNITIKGKQVNKNTTTNISIKNGKEANKNSKTTHSCSIVNKIHKQQ